MDLVQRNPQAHQWPQAITERFVALWTDGVSATLIAQELGVSRNAVLGKRNRMQLPTRKVEAKKEYADGRKVKRPRVRKDARVIGAPSGFKKPRVMKFKPVAFEPRLVDIPEPSNEFRCDFGALADDQCRYAYGDGPFEFCGHPKRFLSSYCEYHTRLCRRAA